jgi:hypothetical protein
MRDPHVDRLHYEIGSGANISYRDPPPVSFATSLGQFDLRDGKVTFEPAEHFATEEEARDAVTPFLRSWEVEADLAKNYGTIRFKFVRADLTDRDPPKPGEPQVINVMGAGVVVVAGTATLHLGLHKYPDPPAAFRSTPEVELGYRRWTRFLEGKEPLPSMAYFILTLLESAAGGRPAAASTFRVDRRVLAELGRLSSTKGDGQSARKLRTGQPLDELTGAESNWLQQAVRLLIRRLGEHASGAPLSDITLNDLPSL